MTKVKKAVSKPKPKAVSKPKAKSKVEPLKPWICIVRHAGSGMVFEIHKFVSEKEYNQAYKLLEPLVGDYWGGFSSYGEWPVVNLEEAKLIFEKVFDPVLKEKIDSFEKVVDKIKEKKTEISKHLEKVKKEMMKEHGYAEWKLLLKSNKKQAAQSLEFISRNHIVSIFWAFENRSMYMFDMKEIEQNFVFVFSTQEDKRAFELYLQEVLHWPVDEMKDFDMSDAGVIEKVYLIEDIKKTVKESDEETLYWG